MKTYETKEPAPLDPMTAEWVKCIEGCKKYTEGSVARRQCERACDQKWS